MPYRFTIRSGVCSLLFFLRVLVLAFLATRTIWVAILAPSFAATYFSVHAPGSVGWTRAELDVGHQTLPLLVLWHRALLPSMTGHLQELGEVDISRGRILIKQKVRNLYSAYFRLIFVLECLSTHTVIAELPVYILSWYLKLLPTVDSSLSLWLCSAEHVTYSCT